MKKAYFDTSAIVKLGKAETESYALMDYLSDDHVSAFTSVLSEIEVRRTLQRNDGADSQDHVAGFFLLELTQDIRNLAVDVEPSVRSLDAIHLATALSIQSDIDFVTYDDRLAAAAKVEGLRVVQPGRVAR